MSTCLVTTYVELSATIEHAEVQYRFQVAASENAPRQGQANPALQLPLENDT